MIEVTATIHTHEVHISGEDRAMAKIRLGYSGPDNGPLEFKTRDIWENFVDEVNLLITMWAQTHDDFE